MIVPKWTFCLFKYRVLKYGLTNLMESIWIVKHALFLFFYLTLLHFIINFYDCINFIHLFFFQVNMIKSDGKVINFNNPTVQASLSANTFAISGHGEEKHFTDLLPNILNHLGADGFNQIKRHASSMAQGLFNIFMNIN